MNLAKQAFGDKSEANTETLCQAPSANARRASCRPKT